MSLSILLSPGRHVYQPGSPVRGTIFLTSSASIAIGSLNVTFIGGSRVKLTQNYGDLDVSNSAYHSRVVLFQREEVLYTGGKWTHQAGQYSWDFEFIIPPSTDRGFGHGSQCPFLANRDALQASADGKIHHLPPSMLYSCRNFTCLVEYVLEATLAPPSGSTMLTRTLTAKAIVDVQPDTSVAACIVDPNHQSHVPHNQIVKRPRSKSNALEHSPLSRFFKLAMSHQQDVNLVASGVARSLTLSILFPRKIEVDQDCSTVDILLSAHLNTGTNSATSSQTQGTTPSAGTIRLTMKTMKITIIQHTHVQAGPHTSTSTRKTYTRKTNCSLPIHVRSAEDEPSPETTVGQGIINLGNVTELRIAKEFLVVDFVMDNISIDHALDLELGFDYEGKTVEFVRRKVPIKVVVAAARGIQRAVDGTEGEPVPDSSLGRAEDSWAVPPAEASGVIDTETDACFSAPPPRYMLRVS